MKSQLNTPGVKMQGLKINQDVKDLNIKLGGQLQGLLLLTKLKIMTRPHIVNQLFPSLKIFNYEIFKSKYFRFLAWNENIFICN